MARLKVLLGGYYVESMSDMREKGTFGQERISCREQDASQVQPEPPEGQGGYRWQTGYDDGMFAVHQSGQGQEIREVISPQIMKRAAFERPFFI